MAERVDAKPTLSHRFEYAVARTLAGGARLLGPRGADRMGKALGNAVHGMWGRRRDLARRNMKAALGDSLTDAQIETATREAFQNIGRMFVEFARFPLSSLPEVKQNIVADGVEYIEEALSHGKGAVFLTCHFGNWELLGVWVAAMGYPMDFLVGSQHNRLIQEMIIGFRRSFGVGIIEIPNEVRRVFKSLKANRIVGLVADQHAPAESVVIDFFGRPVSAARGPALFATRCNCPILPSVLLRESPERHRVIAGKPIYPPKTGDAEADIRQMTIAHTQFFEACIRRYPSLWMWTHNRWKVGHANSEAPRQKAGNHRAAGA